MQETWFICRTPNINSNQIVFHLISRFLRDEEQDRAESLVQLKQNLMHEDSRNQTALWLAAVVMPFSHFFHFFLKKKKKKSLEGSLLSIKPLYENTACVRGIFY